MVMESSKNFNNQEKVNSKGQYEIDFSEKPKEKIQDISKKFNVHENLLSEQMGEWFACGMPIEEYVKERAEVARSFGVGDPNLMSKKGEQWLILYFGDEIAIEEWKIKMDKLYSREDDTTVNYENRHH